MPLGSHPKQTQSREQKQKMTQDQSTNVDNEDEFYEDANDEFPSMADLVVGAHSGIKSEILGRLIAVWPRENGKDQGKNGTYDWTEAVCLVLDDGPDGAMFTDRIGKAPVELPLRFSTKGIQSRLGPRLDGFTKPKRDEDGQIVVPARPQKYVPMIGRVNARPAKEKGNNPPIGIRMMEPNERPIARKFETEIREISAKLKAKDETVEDAKAFE